MICPKCGELIGMEEAVPKSVIRKMLTEEIDRAESTEDRLRAIDLLSKLEQYTGSNLKRDPKKMGVFIVQQSMVKKLGPGKSPVEGDPK